MKEAREKRCYKHLENKKAKLDLEKNNNTKLTKQKTI